MSNHEEIAVSPMDADANTIIDTLWLYALTKYPDEDERDTFWHKISREVQSYGKAHGVFPPPE